MTRVKRRSVARTRRKKVLILTKGAIGSNSKLFRIAQQHLIKAKRYSYIGRRVRKREYRILWITRLNMRVKLQGKKYSSFINHIRKKNCLLNRKILVQLSFYDPIAFARLCA